MAGDTMQQKQVLKPGELLIATDRSHILVMQTDGNLCVYRQVGSVCIWATNTQRNPGAFCTLQSDGNLVVYPRGGGRSLWAADCHDRGGVRCTMQTDGNLVVYAGAYGDDRRPIWASK